jgi:hypothetical protein
MEEKWMNIKTGINEAAEAVVKSRRRNRGWISDETVGLIEKRRDLKMKGAQAIYEYRRLSAMIQRSCRQDKKK